MKETPEMKVCRVDTKRLWLSNKEASKYLGVSKDWLKDRRNEGKFIIPLLEIRSFLSSRKLIS